MSRYLQPRDTSEDDQREQRTEAQINDERRPEAMKTSISMFNFAEDDETPAIEQKIVNQDIIAEKSARPTFEIDDSFKKEMAEVNKKRAKELHAKHAAQKAAEEIQEQKRKAELEKKLKESQTLDPDEIAKQLREEHDNANKDKLYPDKIASKTEIDEEIWRRNITAKEQLPGRAKLTEVEDKVTRRNLRAANLFSFASFITLLLLSTGIFNTLFARAEALVSLVYIALCACVFLAVASLHTIKTPKQSSKTQMQDIQRINLATIMPTFLIRQLLFTLIAPIQNLFIQPLVLLLWFVAIISGIAFQYNYLQNRKIPVDSNIVALNTLTYIIYYTLSITITITTSKVDIDGIGLVSIISSDTLYVVALMALDGFAYKMNKTS